MLAGVILVLACCLGTAQTTGQQAPVELVKAVIYNEVHPANNYDAHWKYRLEKTLDGKQETREVVETKSGSLDKLLSIAGYPLNDVQQRGEADRILRLSRDPGQQRKAEQARRKDAEQCNSFLQMIPNAFVFENAGQDGDLLKITFRPNPNFQAPSREGKVLQQMAGEMWVDARQKRLVSIDGQLVNEVKFGGGLLGHLEKGGQFGVKRAELATGDWEVTEINVNMHGKALLFKSISVQQKEIHSNFERVPEDLTLGDAANLLLQQALVATKQ
jgi:hypothetical protein